MNSKILLRISAGLSLFTFLGHTAGSFMPIPADQPEHLAVHEAMLRKVVPMPMGAMRSYDELFYGNTFCVSVLLLLIGLSMLAVASQSKTARTQIVLNSLALLAVSGLSAFYFFPLPTFCTGLGGTLGLLAAGMARKNLA